MPAPATRISPHRAVRAAITAASAAMKAFDYGAAGCRLDTTPGRIMYLYFHPGQYFKYTRPIRRLEHT